LFQQASKATAATPSPSSLKKRGKSGDWGLLTLRPASSCSGVALRERERERERAIYQCGQSDAAVRSMDRNRSFEEAPFCKGVRAMQIGRFSLSGPASGWTWISGYRIKLKIRATGTARCNRTAFRSAAADRRSRLHQIVDRSRQCLKIRVGLFCRRAFNLERQTGRWFRLLPRVQVKLGDLTDEVMRLLSLSSFSNIPPNDLRAEIALASERSSATGYLACFVTREWVAQFSSESFCHGPVLERSLVRTLAQHHRRPDSRALSQAQP
jgi:hypothetical protein